LRGYVHNDHNGTNELIYLMSSSENQEGTEELSSFSYLEDDYGEDSTKANKDFENDYNNAEKNDLTQKPIALTNTFVNDASQNFIRFSVQLNSTELVRKKLEYTRNLQFDEKKAEYEILHDKEDRSYVFNEASRVISQYIYSSYYFCLVIFYIGA
jgi:hypothetical protein